MLTKIKDIKKLEEDHGFGIRRSFTAELQY